MEGRRVERRTVEGRGGEQRRVKELRREEREERGVEERRGEKRGGEKIPLVCSHVLPLPSPSCAYYERLHLRTATGCSTCTER